jgi:hypothetical protein
MTGPDVGGQAGNGEHLFVSATYLFRPVPDLLKFHSSAYICTHLPLNALAEVAQT